MTCIELKEINTKFNSALYDEAYQKALSLVAILNSKKISSKKELYDYYRLGCLFVDIGSVGSIEDAINQGLIIFDKYPVQYEKIIKSYAIEYNFANAKSALFKLQKSTPGFQHNPQNTLLLTETKNHYWRAYKSANPSERSDFPQLFVNLGNVLSSSGRIPEALQYYDFVLRKYPDFPKALASRSKCLERLNILSKSYSKYLLLEIFLGYKKAIESKRCDEQLRKMLSPKLEYSKKVLHEAGYNLNGIDADLLATQKEYLAHSDYRKFCLDNYLSLSEHSLYCFCKGSSVDNLTIPLRSGIAGDFVPKMELLLNRLKSEYSLARRLYYEAQYNSETIDHDTCFTELKNSEVTGIAVEKRRTAFRLCSGILDKIARGICELFDLSTVDENIYFESFWKNKDTRWKKINALNNVGLFGLYSIATDLNSKVGEWSEFKIWRNSLEHGILIITQDEKKIDIYDSLKLKYNVIISTK